jgi:hypothetical protein
VNHLPGGQLAPAPDPKLPSGPWHVAQLMAAGVILMSPGLLAVIVVASVSITSSVIWFVARILFAPTAEPTERLCWLLTAARGCRTWRSIDGKRRK